MTTSREEFEKWLSQTRGHSKDDISMVTGVYLTFPIQFAFTAWEARTTEIERLNARVKELEEWERIETLRLGHVVALYSALWIDDDFNPEGIREGFRTESDTGPIISAWWNDNQDCYETDTNSAASHWMHLPKPPTE